MLNEWLATHFISSKILLRRYGLLLLLRSDQGLQMKQISMNSGIQETSKKSLPRRFLGYNAKWTLAGVHRDCSCQTYHHHHHGYHLLHAHCLLGTALSGGKAIMARKNYLPVLYIIYVFVHTYTCIWNWVPPKVDPETKIRMHVVYLEIISESDNEGVD